VRLISAIGTGAFAVLLAGIATGAALLASRVFLIPTGLDDGPAPHTAAVASLVIWLLIYGLIAIATTAWLTPRSRIVVALTAAAVTAAFFWAVPVFFVSQWNACVLGDAYPWDVPVCEGAR
jgi:hypothetical protein